MPVTFNSLIAAIPVKLMAENRKWDGELAECIRRAEYRLSVGLDPEFFKLDIDGTLAANSNVIDLRTKPGFKELRALWLVLPEGGRAVLTPKNIDALAALYPTRANPRRPKHYGERTRDLYELYPWPDQAYAWGGLANLKPAALSDAAPTNLYTEKVPELLEFAAFLEGALHMKDQSAVAIWQAAYDDLLVATNGNLMRGRGDETTGPRERSTANREGAR